MEMDALFGAKNSISKMKPQLLIEKIKSDVSEIEKFVNNLGYKTFPLGLNLLAVHETDPVLSDIKIT
jgi:hypothetical protein